MPKVLFSPLYRSPAAVTLWLIALTLVSVAANAQQAPAPKQAAASEAARQRYEIQLKIDFDALSYAGSERVRWVNRGEHAVSALYFHLYSNLRADQASSSASSGLQRTETQQTEEPRVEITEVRSAAEGAPLTYSIDDQGTTLRLNLRDQVLPGHATEVVIGFKGNVPEIDPDETGLTTQLVLLFAANGKLVVRAI